MNTTTQQLDQPTHQESALDAIPNQYRKLLSYRDSLTQHLRKITGDKIVHRLTFANWSHADKRESNILNINPTDQVWVREIEWLYNNQLWISARVVIPQPTLMNNGSVFTELGNGSLGDILFTDPNLKRDAFEFCQLPLIHSDDQEKYWARRSVFHFYGKPLLVTEIFLPDFFNYEQCN